MDVFTISTSPDANRQNFPPSDWLAAPDWPVPVLADSEERATVDALGLTAFPFTVFVYADGTVAARATGAIPYETFLEAVDFLADQAAAG